MTDIESCNWEIEMVLDKAIDVDRVVNFLKANNHWAYVYTEQHTSLRHYILNAYIVLGSPKNHDWWEQNLGENNEDNEYDNIVIRMAPETPNEYRNRHMTYISLNREYSYFVKIDKGPYIPMIGQFFPRAGGQYIPHTRGKMYNY
jgi:hypothetical protein